MPTFTDAEIAQLKKEKVKAESAALTYQSAVTSLNDRATELSLVDSAFKKVFDYYDSDIIGKYDSEQRWINGRVVTSPIVEADIQACASLSNGRIQPTMPSTDVVRISNFDGSPITTNTDNELQHITDQSTSETTLTSGYGGVAPAASVVTATSITSSSTTLQLTDPGSTYSITPGSVFTVINGSNLAVIKILTFVMEVSPAPPPYVADCTIQVIVAPVSTIPSGKTLGIFSGFTNSERTTKTPVSSVYQPLMNYLVSDLQSKINLRITSLNNQLTAISANLDPQPGTELTTATSNINTSKTFLTSYLVTTDVSNTGLTSLSTERGTRSTQASARVTQITNAYTGRTLNYYTERYNAANNRANTSRGSLRTQKQFEQTSTTSQAFADTLTAQAAAIGGILP